MRVEIRGKTLNISGYVNVVGRESRTLWDASGPFIETIMPGTFAEALRNGGPVELRFNHGKLLGDTSSGCLTLKEDNIGLYAECSVTDADVVAAAENGELRGWSFGFKCKHANWEERSGIRHRDVDGMGLDEVSILTETPAYIATSIEARSADGEAELVEFRVMDGKPDVVRTEEIETHTKTTEEDEFGAYETEIFRNMVEVYKFKRREPRNGEL